MKPVLDKLCSDHANFAKLLNVIEHQADICETGYEPDLDLLKATIAYLEGYPALYHHPLEDALYAQLKAVAPAAAQDANEIVKEHGVIRRRLVALKQCLATFARDPEAGREDLAEAAYDFIDSEWAHMEAERTALFAMSAHALTDDELAALEASIPVMRDPLFGTVVDAPLMRLHQSLLDCETKDETAETLRARA